MLGIELVKDRESKTPDPELCAEVFERTKDHGVLASRVGRFGNVLRFLPPLCITEDDVDFALDVIDLSLKEAKESQTKLKKK